MMPRYFQMLALVCAWIGSVWGRSAEGAQVLFDPPHGVYTQPIEVTLSTDPPGIPIYFTTDGSVPERGSGATPSRGSLVTSAIHVDRTMILTARAFPDAGAPSTPWTQSYLFESSILTQPATPDGFPARWQFNPADYAMDPRISMDPVEGPKLIERMKELPWVSLVADPADLFQTNGIYANSEQRGTNWERPVSLEYLRPSQPQEGFTTRAGFQILGDSSRAAQVPKHSLRVQFKSRYGPSKLEYPVFIDSPVTTFDTLDFLASSIDSVPMNFLDSGLATPLYLRDAYLKQSQLDLGRPGVHTTYAHLFLNGLYWGLYRISERPDAGYASSYFGGKKSDYDVLKHLDFATLEVADGDRVAWDAMYAIAAGGLSSASAFNAIQDFLDVDAFIDYLMVNMHSGNGDWPQKNWYAVRKRAAGEKFRFFCWDGDAVLGLFSITSDRTGFSTPNTPAFLYSQLRSNAEFRQRFGDRIQKQIVEQGALSIAACRERLQKIASRIENGVVGESARWGDSYFRKPGLGLFTLQTNWIPERERVLSVVIPVRHTNSIQQFRTARLYPAVDPPRFSLPEGWTNPGESIGLIPPAGAGVTLYYTLDGSDPRLPGGEVAPTGVAYQNPVSLTIPTRVIARAKRDAEWSARVERAYLPGPPPQFESAEWLNGALHLRFSGKSGFAYRIWKRTTLSGQDWELVEVLPVLGIDRVIDWIDPIPSSTQAFFKLEVPLP